MDSIESSMWLKNLRLLLLLLALFSSVAGSAENPRPAPEEILPANAALQYWQAIALLPAMKPEDTARLGHLREAALDSGTRSFLKACQNSLKLLHRGATEQKCDWGTHPEDGPNALM